MRPCGTERAPIAAPVLISAKAVTWSGAHDSQGGHLERRTRQPGRSPGAAHTTARAVTWSGAEFCVNSWT